MDSAEPFYAPPSYAEVPKQCNQVCAPLSAPLVGSFDGKCYLTDKKKTPIVEMNKCLSRIDLIKPPPATKFNQFNDMISAEQRKLWETENRMRSTSCYNKLWKPEPNKKFVAPARTVCDN
jgi:hypothetical protein